MLDAHRIGAVRSDMARTLLFIARWNDIRSLDQYVVLKALRAWENENSRYLGVAENICDTAKRSKDELLVIREVTAAVCKDRKRMWEELCQACGYGPESPVLKFGSIDTDRWKSLAEKYPGYVQIFEKILCPNPRPLVELKKRPA